MVPQKKDIIIGVDVDADESRIANDKATFIKGLQYDINNNPNTSINKGSNLGVFTPPAGTLLISQDFFPAGDNYCIGSYYSKETNELFVFVHNSDDNHFIYRITSAGVTQKVYQGACLNFQRDPEHFILDGRCFVRKQLYIDHNGDEQYRVFLGFTDNYGDIRLISVEDSVATNSFDPILFPYFNVPGAYSCSPCDYINLAVAHSMKCIGITQIERTEDAEKRKQNITVNNGWQFRIRYIDVYGRRSAWGIISDLYMTILGGNCVQTNNSLARCYRLNLDAGCPLVDKIEVAFSKNNGEWYLYDTIEKYDNCQDVPWYQRQINNPWQEEKTRLENEPDPPSPEEILELIKYLTKYNSGDNTFDYTFCGDKECLPIDINETDMNFIPVPKASSSMGALNKGMFLYNNKREFNPLACSELDKITVQVVPPAAPCEDEQPLRKIVVYVPIYEPISNKVSFLWKSELPPLPYVLFGKGRVGLMPDNYAQIFNIGRTGFIGYLAGTKYTAISEQVYLNLSNTISGQVSGETLFPIPPITSNQVGNMASAVDTNNLPVQKFTFNVPPGKYSFRISGHLLPDNPSIEKYSTTTYGTIQLGSPGTRTSGFRELIIDCCSADVVLNQLSSETLVIYDMSAGTALQGYLKETPGSPIGLEYVGLSVTGGSTNQGWCPQFTDYNGHFFAFSMNMTTTIGLDVLECTPIPLATNDMQGKPYYRDIGNISGGYTWQDIDRRYMRGKISLCDSEIGFPGVLVVCKNGPAVFTDSSGEFEIMMHNKDTGAFGLTDLIFISQAGSCRIVECDDPCSTCFSDVLVSYKGCGDTPRITENINWNVALIGNKKGLESGGRYGIGITMHDEYGRHGAIQANEDMYIDIPPLTETKSFNFSSVLYSMAGITFPTWVKYITFWITENLNNTDRLMWAIDKVEFIDNGGNVVGSNNSPTKIRIYYESLAEYNKQNNFSTNATWQIIEGNEQKSVLGDYVEFIRNGPNASNAWFPGGIQALALYDKDGKYFDIEYQNDLQGLVEGAIIKFIRPKDCLEKHIYYEMCTTVRVTNGTPEVSSGVLPAFDSYFINRQIPVPVYDSNGDKLPITKFIVGFFEHHSPSDFWGDHIWNKGRVNVKNAYEREIRNIQEIALSAALVDRSNFNGLNYFLSQNATSFEEQEWGAGVIAFAELNTLLLICEHNNFVVGFRDNILRLGPDGTVTGGAESGFSNPQRKLGSDYGCQPYDINSIRRHMGLVYYLDRDRNALLQHDYSSAKDVSNFGYKSYLTKKIVSVNPINTGLVYYFTAGINPLSNEYMLSVALMRGEGVDPQFVNNQLAHSERVYETIAIDVPTGVIKHFPHYVPENYGIFPGHQQGAAMFSFRFGEPWNHINNNPNGPYNLVYGVQCKKVLEIVTNLSPETVKKFMYNEVYCKEHKFIADRVITEAGQVSRIRAAYWENFNKFWAAPFLCNTLANFKEGTPADKLIVEGDSLFGRWIKVRYISEDADDSKYCELGGIVMYVTTDEKSSE